MSDLVSAFSGLSLKKVEQIEPIGSTKGNNKDGAKDPAQEFTITKTYKEIKDAAVLLGNKDDDEEYDYGYVIPKVGTVVNVNDVKGGENEAVALTAKGPSRFEHPRAYFEPYNVGSRPAKRPNTAARALFESKQYKTALEWMTCAMMQGLSQKEIMVPLTQLCDSVADGPDKVQLLNSIFCHQSTEGITALFLAAFSRSRRIGQISS